MITTIPNTPEHETLYGKLYNYIIANEMKLGAEHVALKISINGDINELGRDESQEKLIRKFRDNSDKFNFLAYVQVRQDMDYIFTYNKGREAKALAI